MNTMLFGYDSLVGVIFLFLLVPVLGLCQGMLGEAKLVPKLDFAVQQVEANGLFRGLGMISEEHFQAQVRGSRDRLQWGDWQDVDLGHEGGSLVWFGEGVRFVEVIAEHPLRLIFIEPGTQKASLDWKRKAAGEPGIVSRAGWGCGPECATREQPIYSKVTHLVVHHSAGANEARDWAAVMRSIWVLHVAGNGWNDIGYNYLIDPNGVIYEGRAGGDGVIGAHFSGVNTGTMGVCLVGTFSDQAPSRAAVTSLKSLLGWQAEKWKLDASGQTMHAASGLTLNAISGHRDAGLSPRASGTTECPGNVLYTYLPGIRVDLLASGACAISLGRRNYCFGGQAGSAVVAFENPANCEVGVEGGSDWLKIAAGRIEVAENRGTTRRSLDLKIGGQIVQVTQAENGVNELPCVARGGLVNSASFDTRPLGLGSIVSLFGSALWTAGSTTQVLVNGNLNAMVFAATESQINFALPGNARIGSARVEVLRDGVKSPEAMFWVTESAPALFVAQNFDDGKLNGVGQPVRAGRALVVYLTGNGVDSRMAWEASIGGLKAEGLFLGGAPGFVGLAQANLIVPESIEAGEHTLRVTVSGVASQELRVAVVK